MDFLTLTALLGEEEWESAEDNMPDLLPPLQAVYEEFRDGNFDDSESFRSFFPSFMERLLTSPRLAQDSELFEAVYDFIANFIEIGKDFLRQNREVFFTLDMLNYIFRRHMFFSYQRDGPDDSEETDFQFVLGPRHCDLSINYLRLVESFCLKGISYLVDILEHSKNITLYQSALAFGDSIKDAVNPTLELLPPIQETIFTNMLRFDEDEIKAVTKRDIDKIVTDVNLMLSTYKTESVLLRTDKFTLQFALKCFGSNLLEKRLHGLLHIEDIMSAGRNYDTSHEQVLKLVEWVHNNRIIESVFDRKTTHDQLVKQSRYTLFFLVENNGLLLEQLALIWECTKDKYLSPFIFDLLHAITPRFQPSHFQLLAEKIVLIPQREWTLELIDLYYDLHRRCRKPIKATSPEAVYNQLWNLVGDKSDTSDDVLDAALQKIFLILLSAKESHIYDMLITNIENEHNVIQTLILLEKYFDNALARTHHLSSDDEMEFDLTYEPRTNPVATLCRERKLLQILAKELCAYKTDAYEVYEKNPDHYPYPMEGVYIGRFRHSYALSKRFDMLTYCIKAAPGHHFSQKMLDVIFHRFVRCQMEASTDSRQEEYASHPEETSMCLKWLTSLVQPLLSGRKDLLGTEFTNTIFRLICDIVSFHHMTIHSFACFRAYFCAVNIRRFKIKGTKDGSKFRVDIWPDKNALHFVWVLANEVIDPQVQIEAVNLLISCYINISPTLMGEFPYQAQSFIKKCISGIHDSIPNSEDSTPSVSWDDEDRAERINRHLTFLQLFFERTQKRPVQQDSFMTIHPIPRAQTKDQQEALDSVIAVMGEVSEMVAILALQKSNWDNNVALNLLFDPDELRIIEHQAEQYQSLERHNQLIQRRTTPYQPPTVDFVRSELYDFLIGLLSCGQPGIDLGIIWKIVDKLPPNRDTIQHFETLCQPNPSKIDRDFSELFEVQFPYKLLFCLKKFDSYLIEQERYADRCTNFVLSGGIKFILNAVHSMTTDQHALKDSVRRSCLVYLLRIIGLVFQASVDTHLQYRNTFILPATTRSRPKNAPPIDHFGEPSFIMPAAAILHLKTQMNFSQFIRILINLIYSVEHLSVHSSDYSNGAENLSLVFYSISLIISCVLSDPPTLQQFASNEQMQKFLYWSILDCPNQAVRGVCVLGFYRLCLEYPSSDPELNPNILFLSLLATNYPFLKSSQAKESFDLLVRLVEICLLKYRKIAEKVLNPFLESLLKQWERCDGDYSEFDCDNIFVGTMKVLKSFFENDDVLKKKLAPYLIIALTKTTIAHGDNTLRCLTRETRKAAFDLILVLASDPKAFNTLLKQLQEKITIRTPAEREYQKLMKPTERKREYAGLQNLNNVTCYASSLLQQFFMTPEIRYGLLNMEVLPPPEAEPPKQIAAPLAEPKPVDVPTDLPSSAPPSKQGTDDNPAAPAQPTPAPATPAAPAAGDPPVQQPTKSVPTSKQGSEGQDIEPMKSPRQQPKVPLLALELQKMFLYLQESERMKYDPRSLLADCLEPAMLEEQQDVDEFFTLFTDRLEGDFKLTNQPKLIQTTFECSLNRSVVCQVNPQHRTEGIEPITTLSVEMENKASLEEALYGFFQGEKIQDYHCAACKKQVEVTRSYSLTSLPNTLIIHLKRFTWSVTYMEKTKICTKFEYPSQLDMSHFVSDSSKHSPENCLFELVGVIVHSGSADLGHYYSIIKERTSHEKRWFKFDDHIVTPFDPADFPEETYGGELDYGEWNSNESMKDKVVYMLFYEKINHTMDWTDYENNQKLFKSGPPQLRQIIHTENQKLLNQKLQFDETYFEFAFLVLGDLKMAYDDPMKLPAIQMATIFVMEKLSVDIDLKKEGQYQKWCNSLRIYFSSSIEAAKWFVSTLCAENYYWLHFHLLFCPVTFVRHNFYLVLDSALKMTARAEEDLLFNPDPDQQPILLRFIDFIYDLIEDTRPHWQRFHQFFATIEHLILLGHNIRKYMIGKGFFGKLVDYYCPITQAVQSPRGSELSKSQSMVKSQSSSDLSQLSQSQSGTRSLSQSMKERANIGIEKNQSPAHLSKLVCCISSLLRCCQIDLEDDQHARHGGPAPTNWPHCELLRLSDQENSYLHTQDFLKALTQLIIHYCDVKSNTIIFCHLAWQNHVRSKALVQIMVRESYNIDVFQNMKQIFVNLFQLEDGYAQYRIAETFNPHWGLVGNIERYSTNYQFQENALVILELIVELIQTNNDVAGWFHFAKASFVQTYKNFAEVYKAFLCASFTADHSATHKLARLDSVCERLSFFIHGCLPGVTPTEYSSHYNQYL